MEGFPPTKRDMSGTYQLYTYVNVIINGLYDTWVIICTLVTQESTNHIVALFISGIKWLDHCQWQSLDRSSCVLDPRGVMLCVCTILTDSTTRLSYFD
jgi:hypothetical protein